MKKFAIGLLSAVLTLSLCQGFAMKSMAAEEPAKEAYISTNIQMDGSVAIPNTTFEMYIEKVSVDGLSTDQAKASMPVISVTNFEYTSGDTAGVEVDDVTNKKTVTKTSVNIVPLPASYPHAGHYVYRIQQRTGTFAGMTYSTKVYNLNIYVYNVTPTVDNPRGLEIGKVVVTTGEGAEKAEVTPTGTGVTLPFENIYIPTAPTEKNSLEISNTVTGDLADKTKEFNYSISLDTLPAVVDQAKTYIGNIVDKAGNKILDAAGQPKTVTISLNNTQTFVLKDGQKLCFSDLPYGAKVTTVQTPADKYTTSVTITTGGTAAPETTFGASDEQKATITLAETGDNKIDYVNNIDTNDIIPTGIITDNLPFIALILVAVCGLAGYVVLRRKKYNN